MLFTAVAFLTTGTICVALYLELKRELSNRVSEELTSKLELIRHLSNEVSSEEDAANLRRIIDDIVVGHGALRVWIGSDSGQVFYGGRRLPDGAAVSDAEITVVREDGVPLRALASALPPNAHLPGARLIVALDERTMHRTLVEFRLALAAVTLASVLAAGLLGALVARRGLAPLRRLAEEAGRMHPGDLSRRLDATRLPDELQNLGHAFNGVLDRLQLTYKQMESFNSDVAHELRSPLTNLLGETQLALSRERDNASYRDTLASNLEELERLRSMVNDMLFLARADQGDRIERYQEVDLAIEAKKVLEYYELTVEEAGIRGTTSGIAVTSADAGLIRRALSNLVSNAIRYTPRGSSFQIRLVVDDNFVRLCVSNPGPTIEPSDLVHLFTRFFRSDTARGAGEHFGLGLAIVKAIATMHGGEVFATSAAGATEIGMRLPRRPPLLSSSHD